MRLKSVFISDYKNLKDFSISFETDDFIDIFVGKNGSGKSNFLEALIEIFHHIFEFDRKSDNEEPSFNYKISYEIDNKVTDIEWRNGSLFINEKTRKTWGQTPIPDNVLLYYSGHNDTISKLLEHYLIAFRSRIKRADFNDSPKFIGVGSEYKELLLSSILLQPETCVARKHLINKLEIKEVLQDFRITLSRPLYAKGANPNNFDVDVDADGSEKFWRPEGITKGFLNSLLACKSDPPTDGRIRNEGYFSERDEYVIYVNLRKWQKEFSDQPSSYTFGQLNNLKMLGMLKEISVPLNMMDGSDGDIGFFSDGQFQSVYIYSLTELFKDRQCLTFLDEPDAFLHPEWQFQFLDQVLQISETAAKTNHILMTSHSASTIAAKTNARIHAFEHEAGAVTPCQREKGELIKSLSAGLITFSEKEARLNIRHFLKNTDGPILFTEGVSDEIILETAWGKLNPDLPIPFEIQSAFDCGFLGRLLRDETLYQNDPDRIYFGLFDFDDAYNQWNFPGEDIESDPAKCLVRKRENQNGYALLLPVPVGLSIRNQVINPETGQHYESKSRLTIELLFRDVDGLEDYFEIDPTRPGECIRFRGKKTRFASRVVSDLAAEHFENFRPIFEFVQGKIEN